MDTPDDEFLQRLRATFRIEAEEHVQEIAAGLLQLEKQNAQDVWKPTVEKIFRAAHSLKGAARAVDFTATESHCQTLEDLFTGWKRQSMLPPRSDLDQAHRTFDLVAASLSTPLPKPPSQPTSPEPNKSLPAPSGVTSPPPPPPPPPVAEAPPQAVSVTENTVRIAVSRLDTQLIEAEEMLAVKHSVNQRADDLRHLVTRLESWRKEWAAVEPEARVLRRALERKHPDSPGSSLSAEVSRLLRFVEWNIDHNRLLENDMASLARTAQQDRHVVGKLVDDLLEDAKKLLLLPFSTLTASFPKLVRDLCRDQGKEASLIIRGEEVEMDKRVLEEIKDPLIHLLRNSVDHGIESPELRLQNGKPHRGTITVTAAQVDGNKVEIVVADDGAGIARNRVREAAIKKGLLSKEEAQRLSDLDLSSLVFQPEVSTSPIITRLSGRGLGLAIVRERAEKLGGTVEVDSQAGVRTSFRICVPATRATFRGVLLQLGNRRFIVPTMQVERIVRIRPVDVQSVEGRETITLDGKVLSLVQLADVLAVPRTARPKGGLVESAILLGHGDQRLAFLVDAILDEQEVLVKPFRKPLSRVRHIAGATVLGTGEVALVLHVADLLQSARQAGQTARPTADKTAAATSQSILVAEDSITSRMLIKTILESAGYRVKTAVDGAEAYAVLRTEHFDVVVSDVEMPRLNGFDLTAKIRADRELGELPVVLVTALETREDRERGIDVGANAYLVKSNFDQSNLLETIRRLI